MQALRPAVVLVRPQEEGNIGAVARAMANTGLSELILIQPRADVGSTARAFAVGGEKILDQARPVGSLRRALAPYRRVVGTTSGRGRELPAPLITPRELPEHLAADPPPTTTALVFGPEASGLTNEELAHCSLLIRIPSSARQPTLNLAQAVLVVTYELYLARSDHASGSPSGEPAATGAEVEQLFEQLAPLLQRIGFARDDTFAGVLRDLRRLAYRAGITSREVQILRGICRRGRSTLERLEAAFRSETGSR